MGLYILTDHIKDELRRGKNVDTCINGMNIDLPQRLLLHPRNLTEFRTNTERLNFCRNYFFNGASCSDMYVGLTVNMYRYPNNLIDREIIDGNECIIGLRCGSIEEAAELKQALVSRDYKHQSDPQNQEMPVDNGTREDPDSNIVFIAKYIHPRNRHQA